MKNNTATIGQEQIETNATLRTDEEQNIALWEAMRPEIEETEPRDICQRGDPRDPAYDPEHDWRYLGADEDGHTYYRCRKCGKDSEG